MLLLFYRKSSRPEIIQYKHPVDVIHPTIQIFICMKKLQKHICIRLSSEQFRKLAEVLVNQERTKSEFIRSAINSYLNDSYDKQKGEKPNENEGK
jgi:hypothetical protein